MKKLLMALAMLVMTTALFAQSYFSIGGNAGFSGSVGGSLFGGVGVEKNLYLVFGTNIASQNMILVSMGARYYPFGSGLQLGLDTGLGDWFSDNNDNWCAAASGSIGYTLWNAVTIGVKANFYFTGTPQSSFGIFVDFTGVDTASSPTAQEQPDQTSNNYAVDESKFDGQLDVRYAPYVLEGSIEVRPSQIYIPINPPVLMGNEVIAYHLFVNGNRALTSQSPYFVIAAEPNKSYVFTVTISNPYGESPQSSPVLITTPAPKPVSKPVPIKSGEPIVSSIQQATEWVNANIKYDYAKARNDDYYLLSPKQVLAARSGVCRDMVVLTMKIVYDSLGIKANFVGIEIAGTPGHAILEYNGKYFDPTNLQTYTKANIRQVGFMTYSQTMDLIGKQLN